MIIETCGKGTRYGPVKRKTPSESPSRFAHSSGVGGNGSRSIVAGSLCPVRRQHGDRYPDLDGDGASHSHCGCGAKCRPLTHPTAQSDGYLTSIGDGCATLDGDITAIAYRHVRTYGDTTARSDPSA
jgi:hypothetical protein